MLLLYPEFFSYTQIFKKQTKIYTIMHCTAKIPRYIRNEQSSLFVQEFGQKTRRFLENICRETVGLDSRHSFIISIRVQITCLFFFLYSAKRLPWHGTSWRAICTQSRLALSLSVQIFSTRISIQALRLSFDDHIVLHYFTDDVELSNSQLVGGNLINRRAQVGFSRDFRVEKKKETCDDSLQF